jgi:hypothetical protein
MERFWRSQGEMADLFEVRRDYYQGLATAVRIWRTKHISQASEEN